MSDRVSILKAAILPEKTTAELTARFHVHELPQDASSRDEFFHAFGPEIRGVAVRKTYIDRAFIDGLPRLEIIASYSAGLENVDVAYAQSRGIRITNTSHILAEEVANLGLGLVLSLTRGIVAGHAFVQTGRWERGSFPLGRSVRGMRVGIVGLGHIGAALALRLEMLGARIAYTGPRPKDVDYTFHADILSLARWSEVLVLTCPLTPETRGLIGREVIECLGPQGYLVNIARGGVADERVLIEALASNSIAGLALDVFQGEPHVPEALRADPRVVLTPHIGSGTVETRQRMGDAVVDALSAHFGLPPVER